MAKNRKTPIKVILVEADARLVERFKAYHENNPSVYDEFVDRALAMHAAGRRRYSQWTIIQSIRWDYDLRTRGDVFKINNDFIALYARLAIFDHPKLNGFFELRSMKSCDRRESVEERYRKKVG